MLISISHPQSLYRDLDQGESTEFYTRRLSKDRIFLPGGQTSSMPGLQVERDLERLPAHKCARYEAWCWKDSHRFLATMWSAIVDTYGLWYIKVDEISEKTRGALVKG